MPDTIDINAANTYVDPPLTVNRAPLATIPSIINIPPQIAVTAFWVMLGIGIGWWMFSKHQKSA